MNQKQEFLLLVWVHQDLFVKDDALVWFQENYHIFEAFCREMDKALAEGREHFSGYTIWEDIRHRTNTVQTSSPYKVDQNRASDTIKAYVLLHPDKLKFFRFKRNNARTAEFVRSVEQLGGSRA